MLLAFRVWVYAVGVCAAGVKLTFTLFDVYAVDVYVCWRLCLLALMPLCCWHKLLLHVAVIVIVVAVYFFVLLAFIVYAVGVCSVGCYVVDVCTVGVCACWRLCLLAFVPVGVYVFMLLT